MTFYALHICHSERSEESETESCGRTRNSASDPSLTLRMTENTAQDDRKHRSGGHGSSCVQEEKMRAGGEDERRSDF